MRYDVWKKTWKKWTAMYWFAHKANTAVINKRWIWQCKAAWKLVTKWFINPLSRKSLNVFPISSYVSSCFTYCFPSFFGYFPCFRRCFSLIPILSLKVDDFIVFCIVSKTRILLTEIVINLELLNVDLPYIYTCMFYVCVNSNIIPPNFRAFYIPLTFSL